MLPTRPKSVIHFLTGIKRRISILPLNIVFHSGKRIMKNGIMQGTHILIGNKFFMHLGFSKTYLRFVIKSGYSIRVPPAIADPALGKKVFPRKMVYRIFGHAPPQNLLYFLSPLWSDLFIRVNIQHPVMASPVCTQIFLFTVPMPIHAKNLIGELPTNFHSAVRTMCISTTISSAHFTLMRHLVIFFSSFLVMIVTDNFSISIFSENEIFLKRDPIITSKIPYKNLPSN